MAVTSQQVRSGAYACNGIQTVFTVPWMFHYDAALLVILRLISDGSETVQVLGSDYTVSGTDVPTGGEITMLVAPSSLYELHIIHDPDLLQRVVLVSGAAVPIVAVERQLDDDVHQNQRTRDLISRGIYLKDTDTDGSGAFDARGNRIVNVADPIDGQDAATKAYVATQTIVSSGLPGPGTLTNAMWNPADLLALTNGKGLTAAEMQVETDPFPASVISPSTNARDAWERLQYQLLAILNWLDGGARGHAYEDVPATDLPTVVAAQVAAALGAVGAASNVLVNGSHLVSQRHPSESATGTIAAGVEHFALDHFYIIPAGATLTWGRASGAGPRHSASKSPLGIQITGAGGGTGCRVGTRLGTAAARALGMGTTVAKNFVVGVKFKNSSTGAASLTPTITIRSTSIANDRLSTKFANASKTVRFGATNLTGAPFTLGQEVAYVGTFDLGTLAAFENGVEIEIELGVLGAATTKATVSDFFLATADISSTLSVDEFYEQLEKCKRFYQKTWRYETEPAQNTSLSDSLKANVGALGQYQFQWQHSPVMMRSGSGSTLTTYNPVRANANAASGAADSTGTSGVPSDSVSAIQFTATGAGANATWHLHADRDSEWYD